MPGHLIRGFGGRGRVLAPAFALALLPWLGGCFTTHVWGGSVEDDDGDGVYSAGFDSDDDGPELDLAARLALTPFTLLLDFCTAPIQACLYGWNDDEDDCD